MILNNCERFFWDVPIIANSKQETKKQTKHDTNYSYCIVISQIVII